MKCREDMVKGSHRLMIRAGACMKISASTYGTLLATGLMAAVKVTKERTMVPWAGISFLLARALHAMSERGKAQLGDKAVLDAIEAARQATEGLDQPSALVDGAVRGIAALIEQLRDCFFRQGRPAFYGAKAIGRDDPGMIVFKRIVESLGQREPISIPPLPRKLRPVTGRHFRSNGSSEGCRRADTR